MCLKNHKIFVHFLKKSREQCSIFLSCSQCGVSGWYDSWSLICKSNTIFYYLFNVPHSTSWWKVQLKEIIMLFSVEKITVKHSIYFYKKFFYIHCSGSDYFSKEMYSKSTCTNHARWWLGSASKVWNRTHSGGFFLSSASLR